MLKFFGIVAVVLIVFNQLFPSSPVSTSSVSDCYNPTIDYQIGMYKQKYPNLSDNQIRFILCK